MSVLFLLSKLQNPSLLSLNATPPRDTGSLPSTTLCLTRKRELGSRTASTGLLAKKSARAAPRICRVTLSTWTATDSSKFKIRTLWPSVVTGNRNLNSLLQSKLQTIARRRGISLSTANGISLCTTLRTLILICTRRLTRTLPAPLMSRRKTKTQNLCKGPKLHPCTFNPVTHKCLSDTCAQSL